jgi:hypothetical protein
VCAPSARLENVHFVVIDRHVLWSWHIRAHSLMARTHHITSHHCGSAPNPCRFALRKSGAEPYAAIIRVIPFARVSHAQPIGGNFCQIWVGLCHPHPIPTPNTPNQPTQEDRAKDDWEREPMYRECEF